jgi:hypothetical protein
MNREQIAAELAERVANGRRINNGPAWHSLPPSPHELSDVPDLQKALDELERRGLIVLVTDDVAVFKYPVEKSK